MPPKKEGGRLGNEVVEAFSSWVQMGAPDPREGGQVGAKNPEKPGKVHWSFVDPKAEGLPSVRDNQWSHSVVDYFVLSKLEAAGLKPSPAADAGALLRRISYDLLGLPPTLEQMVVFGAQWDKATVADEAQLRQGRVPYKSGAEGFIPARTAVLERWVDRFMDSPHYGERWGRHWLDTVRYSDTRGYADRYEDFRYENAWTYRDYVIRSFNEDKPYDQFAIEQLAADRLPGVEPGDPRLAALGFLTVGRRFRNRHDVIDERIDTTTKAFLGLTVSCARCHDHKFDPIPTADYYSLHGIFASIEEPGETPELKAASGAATVTPELQDYRAKLQRLEAANADHYYDLVEKRLEVLKQNWEGWIALHAERVAHGEGTPLFYDIVKQYRLPNLKEFSEVMRGVPSRADHPVWGLLVRCARRHAKPPEGDFAAHFARELEFPGINPVVRERVGGCAPKAVGDVVVAYAELFKGLGGKIGSLLAARRAGLDPEVPMDGTTLELCTSTFPIPLREEIGTTAKLMAAYQKIELRGDTAEAFLFKDINYLRLTHPGAPGAAMVVRDVASPKDSPIFVRGDEQKKGKSVPRRFLACISRGERRAYQDGSGRLELARDIASAENPLFARVAVNRVWMHHFGAGIVPTPDDLGAMSLAPSHPELLDWLAVWFGKNGWSLKKLHKLILLSAAYRQSADPRANGLRAAAEVQDPQNRLLWRANMRRLDLEAIRDSLVLLTGRMDATVGGKPVNIAEEPFSYRRSVYGYVDRTALSDLHVQFDFADPMMPSSRRQSATVPQQALLFLNSPLTIDVARILAARAAGELGAIQQIRELYRILFQRFPNEQEQVFARQFLSEMEKAPGAPRSVGGGLRSRAETASSSRSPRGAESAPMAMDSVGKGTQVINSGHRIERKPLTPLELLVHTMLCSNEFIYVN
jgi:hypothetical protein